MVPGKAESLWSEIGICLKVLISLTRQRNDWGCPYSCGNLVWKHPIKALLGKWLSAVGYLTRELLRGYSFSDSLLQTRGSEWETRFFTSVDRTFGSLLFALVFLNDDKGLWLHLSIPSYHCGINVIIWELILPLILSLLLYVLKFIH